MDFDLKHLIGPVLIAGLVGFLILQLLAAESRTVEPKAKVSKEA